MRNHRSFTAQITSWVVGSTAVILVIILLLMAHFSDVVLSDAGEGRSLLTIAIVISVVSLLVISLLCWLIVKRCMHPLDLLSSSAQRIADGKIDENVPNTGQSDEIGQLQNSFAKMQRSLADFIAELHQKRAELSARNLELQRAYEQIRDADGVKAQFVSRMTTRMGHTIEEIDKLTTQLSEHYSEMSSSDLMKLQIRMLAYSDTITLLLEQMLTGSAINRPSNSLNLHE